MNINILPIPNNRFEVAWRKGKKKTVWNNKIAMKSKVHIRLRMMRNCNS